MKYLWKKRGPLGWAILGIAIWALTRKWLEAHAAVIGPEHFVRVAVKLFYVCAAAWMVPHVERWLTPEIAKWAKQHFNEKWHDEPNDPRLRQCVYSRIITFAALCLLFAL